MEKDLKAFSLLFVCAFSLFFLTIMMIAIPNKKLFYTLSLCCSSVFVFDIKKFDEWTIIHGYRSLWLRPFPFSATLHSDLSPPVFFRMRRSLRSNFPNSRRGGNAVRRPPLASRSNQTKLLHQKNFVRRGPNFGKVRIEANKRA